MGKVLSADFFSTLSLCKQRPYTPGCGDSGIRGEPPFATGGSTILILGAEFMDARCLAKVAGVVLQWNGETRHVLAARQGWTMPAFATNGDVLTQFRTACPGKVTVRARSAGRLPWAALCDKIQTRYRVVVEEKYLHKPRVCAVNPENNKVLNTGARALWVGAASVYRDSVNTGSIVEARTLGLAGRCGSSINTWQGSLDTVDTETVHRHGTVLNLEYAWSGETAVASINTDVYTDDVRTCCAVRVGALDLMQHKSSHRLCIGSLDGLTQEVSPTSHTSCVTVTVWTL